jgi:hypothetical protein
MGWVVSIMPRPLFSPGERTPGTHCTGGWVGPTAGLGTEARQKILSPLPGIEPRSPGRPARNETLHWLSYPAHEYDTCSTIVYGVLRSLPTAVSRPDVFLGFKCSHVSQPYKTSSTITIYIYICYWYLLKNNQLHKRIPRLTLRV